jgi:hypothetical protein
MNYLEQIPNMMDPEKGMFSNPIFQLGTSILANNKPGANFGQVFGAGVQDFQDRHQKKQMQDLMFRSQMAKMEEIKKKAEAEKARNKYIDTLPIEEPLKNALKQNDELLEKWLTMQHNLDMPSKGMMQHDLNKAAAGRSTTTNNLTAGNGAPVEAPIEPKDAGYYIDGKTGEQAIIPPGMTPSQAAAAGFVFGKPPTDPERTAAAFAERMEDTEGRIDELEPMDGKDPRFIMDEMLDYIPFGNFFKTEQGQQRKSERYNWIMANVRDESGAAINADEIPMYEEALFTQLGDSEEAMKTKKKLRRTVIKGMSIKAGRLGTIMGIGNVPPPSAAVGSNMPSAMPTKPMPEGFVALP